MQGSRPFLLVHNSGGSHEMMHYTASHFSKLGKTVAPDLLGHGLSHKAKIEYTVSAYAENLIELCHHESMHGIVFIGLNYGADIGIEMTKKSPGLISHLILIEPPLFMEPWIYQVVEQQIKNLASLKDAHKEKWDQELVEAVITRASSNDRAIALKALKSTPASVKASTFKHLLEWDKKHTFLCSIPALLIQASHPFCTEEKARAVFSHLQAAPRCRLRPLGQPGSPNPSPLHDRPVFGIEPKLIV